MLLSAGADPNLRTGPPRKTALQVAASAGSLSSLEMLVRAGADWKATDDWGWRVQHEAAASGKKEVIRWTFGRSISGHNDKDQLGRTPLLVALMAGAREEAVEELLHQGADPGPADYVGRTCPEAAILYCTPEVAKLVLTISLGSLTDEVRKGLMDLARERDNDMQSTTVMILGKKST